MIEVLRCHYCRVEDWTGKIFENDHYMAKSQGGSNAQENLVLCCKRCNAEKRSMHGDDFMEKLAKRKKHL